MGIFTICASTYSKRTLLTPWENSLSMISGCKHRKSKARMSFHVLFIYNQCIDVTVFAVRFIHSDSPASRIYGEKVKFHCTFFLGRPDNTSPAAEGLSSGVWERSELFWGCNLGIGLWRFPEFCELQQWNICWEPCRQILGEVMLLSTEFPLSVCSYWVHVTLWHLGTAQFPEERLKHSLFLSLSTQSLHDAGKGNKVDISQRNTGR